MTDHATQPSPDNHEISQAELPDEQPEPSDAELLARLLAEAAMDKKALDPVIIDVRGKASYADFLVVCSGRNDRHVLAISDAVDEACSPYRNVVGREGLAEGNWVLLDYGDVIVHIFYAPMRDVYDLEKLWSDVPRLELDVPDELRGNDATYEGYELT